MDSPTNHPNWNKVALGFVHKHNMAWDMMVRMPCVAFKNPEGAANRFQVKYLDMGGVEFRDMLKSHITKSVGEPATISTYDLVLRGLMNVMPVTADPYMAFNIPGALGDLVDG